jgi:hypothetical protein
MRSDNNDKREGTEPGDHDDPKPTMAATPVAVRKTRASRAKPRAAVTKEKKEIAAPPEIAKAAPPRPATTAPRARRTSVKPPSTKLEAAPAASAKSTRTPPRSRRAAPLTSVKVESSIPPTWSDVGEGGKTLPATEVGPILPAPLPSIETAPQAHPLDARAEAKPALDPPVLRSSRVSPYAKALVGIAAAVSLVFFGRGLFRHPVAPLSPVAAAAVPTAVPPPSEAAPAEPTLEGVTPPLDDPNPESAAALKHASLDALEHRKLDDAVAAGEKATALDPTDADSWLILGAAYHDQGNFLAARRSYAACAKQATRGEVRECKFLLQ